MKDWFLHSVTHVLIASALAVLLCSCGVESGGNQTDNSNSNGNNATTPTVIFSGTIKNANGTPASGVTVIYSITGDSAVTDAQGKYTLASVDQASVASFILENNSFSATVSVPLTFVATSDAVPLNFTIASDLKSVTASKNIPVTTTPTPPSTGGGGSLFDAAGNTSAFGIPAGLRGNRNQGKQIYFGTCAPCHPSILGRGASYSSLQRTLAKSPMDTLHTSSANIAHLVAYLNFTR